MFPYFLLGLALLLGGALVASWFLRSEPKQILRAARWLAILLGILLAIYLVTAGRQFLAALMLPLFLPLLRSRGLWQRIKAARGPKPGQTSEVETRYLRMVLDHDSGAMAGEVIEGRFTGSRLEALSAEDLQALWQECQAHDPQSAAVLEAYLDRTQGDAWREAAGGGASGSRAAAGSGRMTAEEAYRILGLEEGADKTAIHEAHRRLMQKMHPDHGGSNYLAAKINEAKAVLLGE